MLCLYENQGLDFDDVRLAIARFFGPDHHVTIHDGDGCELFGRVAGSYCAGTVTNVSGVTVGLALGLPRNELATKLCFDYQIGLAPADYIKRAMVIVGCKDESGDFDEVGDGLDVLQPLLDDLLEKAAILARVRP